MTDHDELLARLDKREDMLMPSASLTNSEICEVIIEVRLAAAAIRKQDEQLEAERNDHKATTIAYQVALNECKLANASTLRERKALEEQQRINLGIAYENHVLWKRAESAEAALAKVFEETKERCAKVCEQWLSNSYNNEIHIVVMDIMTAIRALSATEQPFAQH